MLKSFTNIIIMLTTFTKFTRKVSSILSSNYIGMDKFSNVGIGLQVKNNMMAIISNNQASFSLDL